MRCGIATGTLLLVLLVAGFVAPPSLRADLEHLLLPDSPTQSDAPVVMPSEVAARAAFTILWPSYLPTSARYENGVVGPSGSHGPGTGIEKGSYASFTWVGVGNLDPPPGIRLAEVKELYPMPRGQSIRIRGQSGVVMTSGSQSPAGRAGDSEITIVWQENGLTLSVVGSAVPENQVRHVAVSLQPLNRPTTIPFLDRTAQRVDAQRAIVGKLADFPMPSVTHFADLKVYLVRTEAGFVALIDDDPHRHHPTGWNVAAQTFISPAHEETYDWEGDCIFGPCPRGLDRYPVRIEAGQVVIDLSQRLPGRPVGGGSDVAPSPHPPFVPWRPW